MEEPMRGWRGTGARSFAFALAAFAGLAGGGARAEPYACDLALVATPPVIPAATRATKLRLPGTLADISQLRASSGTLSPLTVPYPGALNADFTAASGKDAPPVALVAGVGKSVCGFAILAVQQTGPVPPVPRPVTLVVPEPASVRADRDAEVLVYVFAADERWGPRQGAPPVLKPSLGTISRVEVLAAGIWRGRWRVPGGPVRPASLEVGFAGEKPQVVALARTEGPVAAVELAPDPASRKPGGAPAVLARVRDGAGNPSSAPVELTSMEARFGPPEPVEKGVVRFPVLAAPGIRDGAILVTGRAERVTVTVSVPIAGPAAAVRVAPVGPVYAGGGARGRLQVLDVTVVDALEQPAAEEPSGSGGKGEFQEALQLGPGHWALPYEPPDISEDTLEEVTISAGPARATVTLNLVTRGLGLTLGLKGGLAGAPDAVGPGAGLEVGLWTYLKFAQLGLVLDAGWWRLARSGTVNVEGTPLALGSLQTHLPVTLSLAWRTSLATRWMLWIQGGGGVDLLQHRAELKGQRAVTETGLAAAATLAVSAGYQLGPGQLFLEARAGYTSDAGLVTLPGASFSFFGLAGYRLDVL